MPRSRMFVNFPMETWLLTKHKPDLNFPRRRLFIFSAAAAATCWQQTSKHTKYKRTSESRARAGEIFERPAIALCAWASQWHYFLFCSADWRRICSSLQSSYYGMWTQGFSHFITPLIKEQQASKQHTMHNGDVHLFGGAGLCSLSLTHTSSRPQPTRLWCSWIMAARLICLPSIKQEPPYHQTEQNAADPSARS